MVDNDAIGKALTILKNTAPPSEDKENLPCPPRIPFHEVLINEAETSVTEADLKVANFQLNFINEAWQHVHSISALSKMVDTTIKATIHRRNLLKMSYGAETNRSKGNVFEPLG
jgi:hypothetical protein